MSRRLIRFSGRTVRLTSVVVNLLFVLSLVLNCCNALRDGLNFAENIPDEGSKPTGGESISSPSAPASPRSHVSNDLQQQRGRINLPLQPGLIAPPPSPPIFHSVVYSSRSPATPPVNAAGLTRSSFPVPSSDIEPDTGSTQQQQQADERRAWRWCYVCSGKAPDRDCELFPERVSRGPGKTNCTKEHCTSYVRYKPKAHLIVENEDKKPARLLAPEDFEVSSIARECESLDRGNTCLVDGDELGITCYSSCTTDFCNDNTRRPGWQHFRHVRHHAHRPQLQQYPVTAAGSTSGGNQEQEEGEEQEDGAPGASSPEAKAGVAAAQISGSSSMGADSMPSGRFDAEFRDIGGDSGSVRDRGVDVSGRGLSDGNEIPASSFNKDFGNGGRFPQPMADENSNSIGMNPQDFFNPNGGPAPKMSSPIGGGSSPQDQRDRPLMMPPPPPGFGGTAPPGFTAGGGGFPPGGPENADVAPGNAGAAAGAGHGGDVTSKATGDSSSVGAKMAETAKSKSSGGRMASTAASFQTQTTFGLTASVFLATALKNIC